MTVLTDSNKGAPPPVPVIRHKPITEEVDSVFQKCIDGEDVDSLMAGLTRRGRDIFFDLVEQIRTGQMGDVKELTDLWKVDYIRRPPTMEEFLCDGHWLGEVMLPTEENIGIFPKWKKILVDDFDIDSQIHNAVFTGSLGIGKSWISCSVILYRIVLARLLRSPQHFFGLSKGSSIYYSILSITRSAVRETIFSDAANFMAGSPFFVEECHFNPDVKYTDNVVPLGNNIFINAGSKGWHVIGKNMMGILLDEGNFRLEENPDVKAYKLFEEVRGRIKGRFQTQSGYLPAISMLASSAADESSFTEQVINDIVKANEPSKQRVYRFAIYNVKPLELKDRWFKVAYGLKNIDPVVLSGWYDKDGNKIVEEGVPHEDPPSGSSIELVPEDYHAEYRRNPRHYLMTTSGVSVGGTHRLFSSIIDIEHCIDLGEKSGLKNPCKVPFIPISIEDDKNIWNFLDHPTFLTRRESRVIPIRHPQALRFAHIDLATQTMAGLAICHLIGQRKIQDIRAGIPFDEYRLIVEYDFILTIVAGQTKPIFLGKIQQFLFWLRDRCGYRFGKVTEDQWQSEQMLQMLEAGGFVTEKLSLDRKKDQYYAWRMAYEEHRIRQYRQEQLITEAEKLLDLPQKIDHPSLGSKDTTDAAAGSYWNAINSDEARSVPVDSQAESSVYMSRDRGPDTDVPPITMVPENEPARRSVIFQA